MVPWSWEGDLYDGDIVKSEMQAWADTTGLWCRHLEAAPLTHTHFLWLVNMSLLPCYCFLFLSGVTFFSLWPFVLQLPSFFGSHCCLSLFVVKQLQYVSHCCRGFPAMITTDRGSPQVQVACTLHLVSLFNNWSMAVATVTPCQINDLSLQCITDACLSKEQILALSQTWSWMLCTDSTIPQW